MFNAASKVYFTVAGLAVATGFAYVFATSDRVGFTNLVFAGAAAAALALAAFAYTPRDVRATTAAESEPAGPRPGDATDVAAPSPWPFVGAVAAGLVAAGAATEPSLILFGAVVAFVATFGWLGQVWREHPSWTPEMTDRLNDRFVVPIALPTMVLVLAAIGVISLSRLFLAVSKNAAPVIGILVAFALLGTFYLLSERNVGRRAMATLATVSAGLVLAAGVAGAVKGERHFESHGEHAEFVLAADDLAFDKQELDFPASTELELVFVNHDVAPHNFSLYREEGGELLFEGETIDQGEVTYELTTPEEGIYFFRCDVHPTQMRGTVNVSVDASDHPDVGENATTTSTSVR